MTKPRGHPDAIVRPKAGSQAFDVERLTPPPSLAEFVDYNWLVKWNVQGLTGSKSFHSHECISPPRKGGCLSTVSLVNGSIEP